MPRLPADIRISLKKRGGRTLPTLELMERFQVPRAAQVWEVPVHTLYWRAQIELFSFAARGRIGI